MNPSASFESTNPPASASAISFDFNLHSTIYNHLSNLSDHLHTLSQIHSRIHPLSADQAPLHESVASDLLTLSASLQGYHTTSTQLVQPINSEPVVLGAERFISRIKEHSALLARLETRKRAIRQVKEDIEKIQVKKGGLRKDLRFTHERIEALVKELGLLVYADDIATDTPVHTRHFTFGGKLVVVDIDFIVPVDNATTAPISRISMSIAPADDESISALGPAAAEVLTANFQAQDGETFVRNLTNISRWDGCSDPPNQGLNCFAVLKGVQDALELIYTQERKSATEDQVVQKGWGKPEQNQRDLVGLSILYSGESSTEYSVLLGVEPRRTQFVHPPLQTLYIPSDNPFVMDEMGMFPIAPTSAFLVETPNWVENLEGDMSLIQGPGCSFALDLSPTVIMTVEAAKKVCEIIGYGMWNSVPVKEEWVPEDTMLEQLLVSSAEILLIQFGTAPESSTVEIALPEGKKVHKNVYVSVAPIPARSIEKIPFSHPRHIFPILRILRQWSKYNCLLKSCFPQGSASTFGATSDDLDLENLLNGNSSTVPSISISPIASPPSFVVVFPVSGSLHRVRISVLENGEIDLDVEEHLKERASVLIENAGIGVGIEFLKKELSL